MEKLAVVWTSGDREVALKMVFMYTANAKLQNWWKEVTLIVWGPSAKLLSQDRELQEEIKKMKNGGINLMACKACSESYGVTPNLIGLGINVIYIGKTYTDLLKDEGVKVVTI